MTYNFFQNFSKNLKVIKFKKNFRYSFSIFPSISSKFLYVTQHEKTHLLIQNKIVQKSLKFWIDW